jgi:acylphosphatase
LPTELHVRLSGRVQGVGFRWFVRERARREGLAGWVRNNADGTVEIAARGDDEAVGRFSESIRQGPPGAKVERVDSLEAVDTDFPESVTVLR